MRKQILRRRLRRIAIVIVVLFGVGAVVVYQMFLAASGNIDNYYSVSAERNPQPGDVTVTFLGTTTLLFDDGETQLMIDGFFSRPPMWKVALSEAYIIKIETDKAAVDTALKRVDAEKRLEALFVAHSHYDHAMDVAYVAQKTGAHLHGSQSTLNIGCGGGLNDSQMSLFVPGKEINVGKFVVVVLDSKHAPALRFINDRIGDKISGCLKQPARETAFTEGGSFDFLIRHEGKSIFVKPSANYIKDALDGMQADVLFLSTGRLGKQSAGFCDCYYSETVAKLNPKIVIPIHWDNLFLPLTEKLEPSIRGGDDLQAGFDCIINRLRTGQEFRVLQGYQSKILFTENPGP